MMARLMNQTRQTTLASDLGTAESIFQRMVGLLGRPGLSSGEGLWIPRCNSIHTFFMKFTIDAAFVDKDLRVKAVYHNLAPWRLTLPAWGAASVFEMPAGKLSETGTTVGDQLYVVH